MTNFPPFLHINTSNYGAIYGKRQGLLSFKCNVLCCKSFPFHLLQVLCWLCSVCMQLQEESCQLLMGLLQQQILAI